MRLNEYKRISAGLNTQIEAALVAHGLKVARISASVEETMGTVRITIQAADANLRDAKGNATTPEAQRWSSMVAYMPGLRPEWLGTERVINGRRYRIEGLREGRSTKCVVLTNLSNGRKCFAEVLLIARNWSRTTN